MSRLPGSEKVPAGGGGVAGTTPAPPPAVLSREYPLRTADNRRGDRPDPPVLVVATVVALVCLPGGGIGLGGATLSVADLASFVLVALVAVRLVTGYRITVRLPVASAFAMVAVGAVVSTMVATDPAAALPGLVRYLQLFVLVPVAVMLVVRTRRDFVIVGLAVLVAGTVQGAVGVVQYLTGTGASFGGETIRAVGTFGPQEIMSMSAVVSYALLVAMAGAMAARRRSARILLAVVAVGLAAPLAFSFSRGSWLATGIALVAMLACLGWKRFVRIVALTTAMTIVLVGGFGVGSGQVGERLDSLVSSVGSPDSSVGDRYHLWHTAGAIWQEHPITGGGMRSFPELRDGHAPLGLSSGSDTDQPGVGYVRQELLSPHNQYLLVLAEQGLVGALALIGSLVVLTAGTLRRLHRASDPALRLVGLGVLGLVVWQMVQFLYGDSGGPTGVLGAVILGLAASYSFAGAGPPAAVPPGAGGTAEAPRSGPSRESPERRRLRRTGESRLVLTATVVSAVLIGFGAFGGVARDLLLASYFGADGTTDAFLVAWTVAESAVPLLIDGAMALLLVPAFTRALAVSAEPGSPLPSPDPRAAVGSVVGFVLPRLVVGLVVVGAVTFACAPWLVRLLAPGIAAPDLGVQAMRIVAGSLLLLGLAGFAAGALRAHLVFGPPAAVSLSFNVGIIGSIVLLHERFGVLSAAIGVTVGAGLMLAVQLPSYLKRLPLPRQVVLRTVLISSGAFVPIAVFTITRQAQVFVERFVGSGLEPGTISHLNYAQKVGQLPSTLALILAVVTFPLLARSLVSGAAGEARRRMEADVRIVGAFVLLATTFLFAFAPRVVETLFERGAFDAADTGGTAAILRIYVLGLLGQALVELLCRSLFSGRSTYLPAGMMALGLAVTAVVAALAASRWGAPGIAAGNAVGITVTALGLLFARRSREASIRPQAIGTILARLVPATALTGGVGYLLAGATDSLPAPAAAVSGGLAMALTFTVIAMSTGGLPTPRQLLGKGRS